MPRSTGTQRPLKVLIVAPHADDEAIASGGLILRARQDIRGISFRAALLTTSFEKGLAETRRGEFEESCRRLGVEPIMLGLDSWGKPDRNGVRFIKPTESDYGRVNRLIENEKSDCIIVPHAGDVHPDHLAANGLVVAALKGREHALLLLTQTWGDLRKPNLLVGFGDDVLAQKQSALAAHATQTGRNRFDGFSEHSDRLNAIRGSELILGFGTENQGLACAEIFRSVLVSNGKFQASPPRVFSANTPLEESIFIRVAHSR